MEENSLLRINKYLSELGYCSRRAADKLIEQGRVTINGKIPEIGTKVSKNDEICVDGEIINKKQTEKIYIAFNKPVGIVCTTDTAVEKDNIIDYINFPSRIFPMNYNEYKGLNLAEVAAKVATKWETENTFEKSISTRDGKQAFCVF
jgi:23S rRNA pseudouridine2604 synthase